MKVFAKPTNILFFCSAIIISTSSCSNTKIINGDVIEDDDQFIKPEMFFPKLFFSDYYKFVEFDNNAYPIINDKFLIKVIEDVVLRVASSKGKIKFSVNRYSKNQVDFNFMWIYNSKTLYKTYSFEIKR